LAANDTAQKIIDNYGLEYGTDWYYDSEGK
jgi:hypothetical protein